MVTVEMLIAVLKEIVVISDRKHDAWDTAHDLLKKYEATRPPHWLKEPNSSTLTCFLGPWKVGVVYFDKCVARHDTCQWATICHLPGINKRFGHFETEDEAKQVIEKAVAGWVSII